MSVLSGVLPTSTLRTILKSAHSTLAISNVPGPIEQVTIAGYDVQNITFWVPNRNATGIGISVLSYKKRLQFGIIADQTVIQTQSELDEILKGIQDEIQIMNKSVQLRRKQTMQSVYVM